jgi:hypothetical protein
VKTKTFILTGDVCHPGKVQIRAKTLNEALAKAEKGEFTVYDEQNECLAFDWNGDESSVEVEE